MSGLIRIDTACSSEGEARTIAQALIQERLAACCQIVPMTSLYRWQGEVHEDAEFRLSVKTVAENFAQIEARVRALHSYDVAQIIATPLVRASQDYADWVQENSRPLASPLAHPLE